LAEFAWKVRKGSGVRRFSDGLVIQGRREGALDLWICRLGEGKPPPRELSSLVPLVAACVSEGIRRDTGVVSWLHWPNLVTVGGRVVGMASVSSREAPGRDAGMVFAVSVDCFSGVPLGFPPGLPKTSIRGELGVEVDLGLLREKILHAVDWYYAEWAAGRRSKMVARIVPTISWMGSEVEARVVGGGVLRGRAACLDDDGSLVLEVPRLRGLETTTLGPGDVELVLQYGERPARRGAHFYQ
jgi:biotin-(acetyl-CoA carboxylase) ligase